MSSSYREFTNHHGVTLAERLHQAITIKLKAADDPIIRASVFEKGHAAVDFLEEAGIIYGSEAISLRETLNS